MKRYMGEFPVDIAASPFAKYTPSDWALYFIGRLGDIDGAHHKMWVLDQVARILNGCEIRIVEARWSSGTTEYRVTTAECAQYNAWVAKMQAGEDGPTTYVWDTGVAP